MNWKCLNDIEGCGLLTLGPKFEDDRGSFQELYNRRVMAEFGIPLPWSWAQDNISLSRRGVLRGFHIQRAHPQGKLVTCLAGRIIDVCLDLRHGSTTYLNITQVELNGSHPQSFYLPPGTAHAFLALTDCSVHYRCTTAYDSDSDGGIDAKSPELAGIWPDEVLKLGVIRSEKDRHLPKLVDYLKALA